MRRYVSLNYFFVERELIPGNGPDSVALLTEGKTGEVRNWQGEVLFHGHCSHVCETHCALLKCKKHPSNDNYWIWGHKEPPVWMT